MPNKPVNPPVELISQLAPWDSRKLPIVHIPDVERSPFGIPGFRRGKTAPSIQLSLANQIAQIFDPSRYPFTASSYSAVTSVAGASTLILGQSDALRVYLMIRNDATTSNVYIDFGVYATAKTSLKLTPGQIVFWDTVIPQGDVYTFGDAADAAAAYTYGIMAKPDGAP